MKTLILLACLWIANMVSAAERAPTSPAEAPPAAATPPANAEVPAPEDEQEDLLPGEKGSADNNVSFPVDI
ncbi:MAG: hypothetical protein ABIT36_02405 [Steroidobacteraceae bacterium]